MRSLKSFLIVSVGCAALAALLPGCSSSDSGGGAGAGAGGAATGGAGAGAGGASAGAGGGAPASGNTAKAGNAVTGATLYTKMLMSGGCNSCHGEGAEGSLGPNISGATPAGLGGWTEDEFYQVVRNGKAKGGQMVCATMPKYVASELSDQDIADIFAFTQSKMVATANMGVFAQSDPACAVK